MSWYGRDHLGDEQKRDVWDMWSPPPSSLVPVCVPPKQKSHALCPNTHCSMRAKRVMAFSSLFCESQNSHCSVLMQNAITFSNRTSLSQEVNRKHISYCVSAAQILLMAKTPWRQINLSLFRELQGKRKYIWHLFIMQARPIWCIKGGWRREGVK